MPAPRERTLPAPEQTIIDAYNQLVAELDDEISRLVADRFPAALHCGPGCASCCMSFSILPVEAALLVSARRRRRNETDTPGDSCPLLVDERCSVYPKRPIICRTQGLPIAYIGDESIEVSACPLNFDDAYPLVHDDLLYLDRFNAALAELNLRYCQTAGLDPERRISIAAVSGRDPDR